jgi:hypothetical protein
MCDTYNFIVKAVEVVNAQDLQHCAPETKLLVALIKLTQDCSFFIREYARPRTFRKTSYVHSCHQGLKSLYHQSLGLYGTASAL